MRIIITGGTGLIGQALVKDLVADNQEVVVLSRTPDKKRGTLPLSVPMHQWDAKTAEGWLDLCEGDYAIVNFAGTNIGGEGFPPTRWTDKRKKLILQSRLDAAAAVVDAVKRAPTKPKVVIQPSAVGYYGNRPNTPVTEEDPSGPEDDFLATVARTWEESIQPVADMGVRLVITRTGIVLSKEGGALPPQLIPFKMFAGGPIGSGKQGYSWIHIDDVVRANRFLIDSENASGPYNVTAPNPVSNAQIGKAIGQTIKRPWFVPVPGIAMRLALGEVADVLLKGQYVLPKRLQEAGFVWEFTEPRAALADLLLDGKKQNSTRLAEA